MTKEKLHTLILTGMLAIVTGCQSVPDELLGLWRTESGEMLSVRESAGDSLRIRFYTTGETRRFAADGDAWEAGEGIADDRLDNARLAFDDGRLVLESDTDTIRAWKVDLDVRYADVDTGDVALHTRLMLPDGEGPFPAIVIVQGSGDDAATRTYGHGDFFAAHGIASIVYDKRGTGKSGGRYNHDFHQLSDDVVAVVDWLKTQPDIDASRIGVSGYSQGGWIGPLAASKSADIGFVIVNYGMINSPRDEERIETVNAISRQGFEGQALEQVESLSLAAIDIMDSNFREGWDEFDRLVERYADEPWMKQLDGTTIAEFIEYPNWLVKLLGPFMTPPGLDWDYTSLDALDELARRGVPSAWLIAGADRSAPNEFTLAELKRRQAAGEPIMTKVFENTDHGILTFVDDAGRRRYGNYHRDYFKTQIEIARRLIEASGVR